MSDNDLIERWDDYVESMGSVMGEVEHMAQQMRDRIEALVKERDRYRDAFNTNCLVLRGTEERVERLEAALLFYAASNNDHGIIARATLKGADHD